MQPERERRAHARVALEIEVTLGSESQFFAGLSGDVSEGGIFVSTYRQLPIGERVSVSFRLPNGETKATGTVRWIRPASEGAPPGLGISFDEIEGGGAELVHEFCKDRPPLYYEVESRGT
jgi:uncharacterized protein (TIGR02266 family)